MAKNIEPFIAEVAGRNGWVTSRRRGGTDEPTVIQGRTPGGSAWTCRTAARRAGDHTDPWLEVTCAEVTSRNGHLLVVARRQDEGWSISGADAGSAGEAVALGAIAAAIGLGRLRRRGRSTGFEAGSVLRDAPASSPSVPVGPFGAEWEVIDSHGVLDPAMAAYVASRPVPDGTLGLAVRLDQFGLHVHSADWNDPVRLEHLIFVTAALADRLRLAGA